MNKIFKCAQCNKYTLQKTCPYCNINTINPKPAKFSPEDKFGYWRRQYKQEHDMAA